MTRPDSTSNRRPGTPRGLWLLVFLLSACTAVGSDGEALQRGDEAFARGDYSEALAEYRLALRQNGENPVILTRAAHAYAQVGRVEAARDHYRQAIEIDPSVADLAAADLLRVARTATERRRDGMLAAAAVEAALELRPGVNLTGLARPLAEHFARQGQFSRALPYFQKAIGEGIDDPLLVLEMARAYEELGDCELALIHLHDIRDDVPVARRSEVDWRVGNCSFELGRLALEEERSEDALEFFQTTIEVGEPRSRLAQAWFESGDILASMGRCSEAIAAFQRVESVEIPSSLLVERARDRIDELRWGRGGDGGSC